MDYIVEVIDTWGRCIARFNEVPLLEVSRGPQDEDDRIRGLLPVSLQSLGPGFRLRVLVDGRAFCEATVTSFAPHWGDTRKLILDRYVTFHSLLEVEAVRAGNDGNTRVSRAYAHRPMHEIAMDAISAAPGKVHYTVAHTAFPDGATHEYQKFLARKSAENTLGIASIATGQWVGADRIDATAAFAKDGDTIAGLVVDGVAWPDLRFMMIDCEETSRNSHAIKVHPEVAAWSDAEYARSGYAVRAIDAKLALQALIDTHGIEFIELNPHRNSAGTFDDRVDAYGRYIGLVYGGGLCFNAALVEQGHSEVYLYDGGRYHVPEMRLKEFFSYTGAHTDSIEAATVSFENFDVTGGIYEILTALAYAARGFVWDIDCAGRISFRKAAPMHTLFFEPHAMSVTLGSAADALANALYFSGNPSTSTFEKTYVRGESADWYGFEGRALNYFSITHEADGDALCEGLLDDLAYPTVRGDLLFHRGNAALRVGELIELRGAPLRRMDESLPEEWNGAFAGKQVARTQRITHRFQGKHIATRATLTSPLRSVSSPLSYIVASQPHADELFQFRLDAATVGLDTGYHLD